MIIPGPFLKAYRDACRIILNFSGTLIYLNCLFLSNIANDEQIYLDQKVVTPTVKLHFEDGTDKISQFSSEAVNNIGSLSTDSVVNFALLD